MGVGMWSGYGVGIKWKSGVGIKWGGVGMKCDIFQIWSGYGSGYQEPTMKRIYFLYLYYFVCEDLIIRSQNIDNLFPISFTW